MVRELGWVGVVVLWWQLFSPALSGYGATPEGSTIFVRAGQMVDVRTGKILPKRVIVVKGGIITQVGSESEITPSAGAEVIELSESWVLPGLIDCHVHLASDRGGVDRLVARVSQSTAAHAYEAAVNARKTLEAGFTTVRNLGDADGVTLALRDAIAEGKVAGPRILDAGSSISTTSGHMDPKLGFRDELHEAVDRQENLCDGPDECRKAVRRQVGAGWMSSRSRRREG